MKKESININGMSCSHCVKAIENELVKLPLRFFSVSIGNVVAEYDESLTGTDEIKKAIVDAGFEVTENTEIEK